MPVITAGEITTFQDYAYAVHDQAEFLRGAMDEIKAMHESHFMTKRNKLLMQEKKALEGELEKSKNSQDQGLKQLTEQNKVAQQNLFNIKEQLANA